MPDFLLELLSEEIPARMQNQAAAELKRRILEALDKANLSYGAAAAFVTPRRLVLQIDTLPAAQSDRQEERRGPRVDAPEKAVAGFLRATGLERDQCEERELKNGRFLFAVIHHQGQQTATLLAEKLPELLADFPWPKSMRWSSGASRWVRPLSSILCLFGDEVISFTFAGVTSGRETVGHRFHAPEKLRVNNFTDYRSQLEKAFVTLDSQERQNDIRQQTNRLAAKDGYTWREDKGLLQEVAGLVERPIVLPGRIDPQFMKLPEEVLVLSMRAHQRYLALHDSEGSLAPAFLMVANLVAEDNGKTIIAGNERVLRARLADAAFFYQQDQKTPLITRAEGLSQVIFQRRLGTLADKTARMGGLIRELTAAFPGTDPELAARAATIAKADLLSEMVGEFPELQGIMGQYYARHDGEDPAVADAIAAHYRPLGPDDDTPGEPIAAALALADKIDSLVGFFAIDERPTGSRDPYALRRAALGIIRIILDNGLRLSLRPYLQFAYRQYAAHVEGLEPESEVVDGVLTFIADRLKVHLRQDGVRHDYIDSVYAIGGADDLVKLLARVEALASFLNSREGENLLAGYRRAVNIVRIEEKKDKARYADAVEPAQLTDAAENRLMQALESAGEAQKSALDREDFAEAMTHMAQLREPIDRFFDTVTVNDSNPDLRRNRLNLLSHIRTTLNQVADFSRIEG